MAIRPSVRFDVFKRDQFTCTYCGKRPPDATLEVDHIIPIVEGGGDEPENLTTACWDCNRGKRGVPLDREPEALPSIAERTELVKERERQLREYHAAVEAAAARQDEQFNRVWNAWFDVWGEKELSRYHTPGKSALKRYIDIVGESSVLDAMDECARKFSYVNNDAVRYLFGILKWRVARLEGRVVDCVYCKKQMLLDPGEDASLEWFHTSCEPKQ